MKTKLTKKQALIIDFIQDYSAREGGSPSYREIMSALGLNSVSAVAEHIDNLVAPSWGTRWGSRSRKRRAWLRKVPGEARSLEVVDLRHPETVELFRLYLTRANEEESEILRHAAEILGLELTP